MVFNITLHSFSDSRGYDSAGLLMIVRLGGMIGYNGTTLSVLVWNSTDRDAKLIEKGSVEPFSSTQFSIAGALESPGPGEFAVFMQAISTCNVSMMYTSDSGDHWTDPVSRIYPLRQFLPWNKWTPTELFRWDRSRVQRLCHHRLC